MGDWNQLEIDEETIALHWLKLIEWFPMVKRKVLFAWERAGRMYHWDSPGKKRNGLSSSLASGR
jgi:hypothetical protein